MAHEQSTRTERLRTVLPAWFLSRIHYFIPLVIAVVIGLPTLNLPYTLINDGVTVEHYRKMAAALASHDWSAAFSLLNSLESAGRFVPVYHILNDVSLFLFGENAGPQRVVHVMKFAVIFVALYALVFRITRRIASATVSLLPFAFAAFMYEKWFRIGAPEANFVAVMALSLLFFQAAAERRALRERILFMCSVSVLPLMYFSKEVSIAFIPALFVLLVMMWAMKKDAGTVRLTIIYLSINVVLVGAFFLARYKLGFAIGKGKYSAQFATQWSDLLTSCISNARFYLSALLSAYYVFLPLPFFIWAYIWIGFLRGRRQQVGLLPVEDYLIWSTTGAALFFSFLVIYLPWKMPTPVYLVPSVYGFCLLLGLTYDRFVGGLEKSSLSGPARRTLLAVMALLFVLKVAVPNVYNMFQMKQYLVLRDLTYMQTLSSLPAVTPRGGTVWTNIPPPEPIYEAGKHLKVFYDRPDIRISNLSQEGRLGSGDILAFIRPHQGKPDAATWDMLELDDPGGFTLLKRFEVSAYSIRPFGSSWLRYGILAPNRWNCRIYRVEKPLRIRDLAPAYFSILEKKPVAGKGFWRDGYLDAVNEIRLRVPEGAADLVIKGKIPHWTNYAFPYRFIIKADNGWRQEISVQKKWPDEFEQTLSLDRSLFQPGTTVKLSITSKQIFVPAVINPSNADRRELLFWLDWLGFAKTSNPGKAHPQ